MLLDIVSGEKIQELCDIYIGDIDNFNYNPLISKQYHKCISIDSIPDNWNNPNLIFCYGDKTIEFSKILYKLTNKCIIIFGNSDFNHTYQSDIEYLNSDTISHIFCQNLNYKHSKASIIPIGLANKQWLHGNPEYIFKTHAIGIKKIDHIFCSFSTSTNPSARNQCLESMYKNNINNRVFSDQSEYINQLSSHKFSICPEGNGLDTHRFWECLYVQTVPIVPRSLFTEMLKEMGLPCVIVDNWDKFNINDIPDYSTFNFDDIHYYNISLYKFRNDILEQLSKLNDEINVVLSFIGTMPSYIIECIKQLRIFYKGYIYLIYSEISPDIAKDLENYNVLFVHYSLVQSQRFENIS